MAAQYLFTKWALETREAIERIKSQMTEEERRAVREVSLRVQRQTNQDWRSSFTQDQDADEKGDSNG